jgi:predicted permease
MHSVTTHLREFLVRIRGLFAKRKLDADLEDELAAHIDLLTQENIRRGMSPDEAHYAARREFGGLGKIEEIYRDQRGIPMVETLLQDLRFGARMLRKNPGFTVVAVLTLALGIGANTAIFSVINTILFARLPYPHADRLVQVFASNPKQGLDYMTVSSPDLEDWKKRNDVFEEIDGFTLTSITLKRVGNPQLLDASRFTSTDFRIVGVAPELGRTFLPEEDVPNGPPVVVLSDSLWRKNFAADPQILGKTIPLNDSLYTVVGIMPPSFQYPSDTELWLPPFSDPDIKSMLPYSSARDAYMFQVIARLKDHETLAHAKAQMDVIAHAIEHEHPDTNSGVGVQLVPLRREMAGSLKDPLLMLFGAVGFLLLIACANLANLSLARATGRSKELGIRAVLGSSRTRLYRQLFTENLLLALLGGGAGWLLAIATADSLFKFLPTEGRAIPMAGNASLDSRVLIFTILVSVLTGLGFGLLPALRSSQVNPQDALKEAGRSHTAGKSERGVHRFLIVSETALALVLLVGAGLLIESFAAVMRVDMGFQPQHVLVMEVQPEFYRYPAKEKEKRIAFVENVTRHLREIPGVQSASNSSVTPMAGYMAPWEFEIEGHPASSRTDRPKADLSIVSPGYFQVMGIRLLKGRDFTSEDRSDSPWVVIIDREASQRYFVKEDPVGKRIKLGPDSKNFRMAEIVGVVEAVKSEDLETKTRPALYWPFRQSPFSMISFVMRTQGDPETIKLAAQKALWAVDPEQPIIRVISLEGLLNKTLQTRRVTMYLLAGFAVVALALAGIGIYGVISYWVTQRTHEIGIRMALGAQQGSVLRSVMGQGFRLILIGVGVGGAIALALARLITSLLFGVPPTDPVAFAIGALVLIGATLLGCYLPARRAMRVDPMVALRYE